MIDLQAVFGYDNGGGQPETAPAAPVEVIDPGDADAILQRAVDRLAGDPLFPPEVIEALRAARAEWIAAE
jgi:hypothetical protein